VTEKRLRKKEQNKTAALRYRVKKRDEHGSVMSEYDQLERRNVELRTKVAEMTKEVDYLKGLIEEICA
jgi:cell division protein FtsB